MDERGESRTDLARRLGVSRARVTQVLSVLDLAPEALELLEQESGPGVVSERSLRGLKGLSPQRQRERLLSWADGESAT
jgi:ParB-like chromosome segregation protein Spo0J